MNAIKLLREEGKNIMSCTKKVERKEEEQILDRPRHDEGFTNRRTKCDFSGPICIDTKQVYDSCRERECVENKSVYFTESGQRIINAASNVRLKEAEIIWVSIDIEPARFHKGFYIIDVKYFIKVILEVGHGNLRSLVEGLVTFDKQIVLYGSEGSCRIFKSKYDSETELVSETKRDNPLQVSLEAAEVVPLKARLIHNDHCCCSVDDFNQAIDVPREVSNYFEDHLIADESGARVLVTLGIFTIVKLERDVQLLIRAIDFCIPKKECAASRTPCEYFNKLEFPIDQFFAPFRTKHEEFEDAGGCGCHTCH